MNIKRIVCVGLYRKLLSFRLITQVLDHMAGIIMPTHLHIVLMNSCFDSE